MYGITGMPRKSDVSQSKRRLHAYTYMNAANANGSNAHRINSLPRISYSRIISPRPRYPAVRIMKSTISGSLEKKTGSLHLGFGLKMEPRHRAEWRVCVAVRIRALDSAGSVKLRIATGIELGKSEEERNQSRRYLARRPMPGNWQSLYDNAPPHCN